MSRVVFVIEARFEYNSVEAVGFDRTLWSRYLQVYNGLTVLVRSSKQYKKELQLEDGVVTVIGVKAKGGFSSALSGVKAGIKLLFVRDDIIFRTPGFFTLIASFFSRAYKVELVGDIEESIGAVLKNRPLAVSVLKRLTKAMVKRAKCVLYVNRSVLPLKYPNNEMYFASNVNITIKNLVKRDPLSEIKGEINIYCVGSLNNLYKGPDIMIDAINDLPKLIRSRLKIYWIGEGAYKNTLIGQIQRFGLNEIWTFKESMPHEDLLTEIRDNCDLFILPSRTEGLPRVVIEAMSLSLPVLAFNVGGISELLTHESGQLINHVDSRLLSLAIERIIEKDTYELGKINFENSKQYDKTILNDIRVKFLRR